LLRDHYLGRRSYSLTICTQDRRQLFTNPQIVSALRSILVKLSAFHCFDIYAYCFMPDHLHLCEHEVRPATYKNSSDNSKASRVLVFAIGLAHYLPEGIL
jgi:REP element-mobilizing transposase RayT